MHKKKGLQFFLFLKQNTTFIIGQLCQTRYFSEESVKRF